VPLSAFRREAVTRFILNGARIDVFLVEEMNSRIGVIHKYLTSRECCPCFYGIASVKPDGQSLLGHRYALGSMWSTEFISSSKFLATVGRDS
jgi:hypothetical protein